jgi:hypothetical protein
MLINLRVHAEFIQLDLSMIDEMTTVEAKLGNFNYFMRKNHS